MLTSICQAWEGSPKWVRGVTIAVATLGALRLLARRPLRVALLHGFLNTAFRVCGQPFAIDVANPPGPECDATARRLKAADVKLSAVLASLLGKRGGASSPSQRAVTYPRRDGSEGPAVVAMPRGGAPSDVLVVYAHGGGYIIGSHRKVDELKLMWKAGCRATIVSVGYRLAPDHRFPTAAHDVCDAVAHFASQAATLCRTPEGAPPPRVVVAGESAGSALALVAALFSAASPQLAGVMLSSPAPDITPKPPREGSSWSRYMYGHFLQGGTADTMVNTYAPDPATREGPWASPALAPDAVMRRLPPVLLHVCERDILSDQSYALQKRLDALGVPCRLWVARGAVHAAPISLAAMCPLTAAAAWRDFAAWVAALPQRAAA